MENNSANKAGKSSKVYIFVATIIILSSAFFVTGCDQVVDQEIKSVFLDAVNSEQIQSIKDLQLDNGYRLGDLIDAGLGSPTYELFDPAEDGGTYITVTGNILYNNHERVAGLQYKKIGETNGHENYEFYTLVYNDIPQNALETIGFFNYLVENYENKMALEATTELTESITEATESVTEASKVNIAESTLEQTTTVENLYDLEAEYTVTEWITFNTPMEWNYSYDETWGTTTLLNGNGMTVAIDEFYSDASVDAICEAEGIDISGYEKIELDLSSDYLAHNPPATYSIMYINDLYDALYISSGGDGNFYTAIYIPEGDKIIKLSIWENMWDDNFTNAFEEEVLMILDDILTSL